MFTRYSSKLWSGLHTLDFVDYKGKKQKIMYAYPVYTPEEAVELGLDVKDWRKCGPGDWGVSDDNYISQCISAKGRIVRFVAGCAVEKSKFLVENRFRSGNFSDLSSRPHVEREVHKERTKRMVYAYARMLLSGTVDWEQLAKIYRIDQDIPIATVKRVLRLKGVSNMVKEELDKLLSKQGLTPEYTLEKIKMAMEIAEKGKQAVALLRGAEFLADLQGLKEKQSTTVEFGISGDFSKRMKELQGDTVPEALPEHAEG